MASSTKAHEILGEDQIKVLLADALPDYAYNVGREWTWTRPNGIWKANLSFHTDQGGPSLKVRCEGAGPPQILVSHARGQLDAAIRFLVAVGAIDRHPDDPIAVQR